jgi:hypothetical protein
MTKADLLNISIRTNVVTSAAGGITGKAKVSNRLRPGLLNALSHFREFF